MDPKIQKELEQEEQTPFHKQLLEHCKGLVLASRGKMSEAYNEWDQVKTIYRAQLVGDKDDQKAMDRKEPTKLIVPTTYMQVQTFIAFCFSMYYQREVVFEIEGTGPDDAGPAKTAEAVLEQNLLRSDFDSRLYQFLEDIALYGLGVLKMGWTRETQKTTELVEEQVTSLFGEVQPRMTSQEVEKVKFLGTKVRNVSPYNFFYDTRVPLSRFQEGEFVASEEEITMVELRRFEGAGEVAGIQYLKKMEPKSLDARRRPGTKMSMEPPMSDKNDGFAVYLTECQCVINPKKFEIDGKPLGDGPPEKWNIWYANDQRIIKAEPLGYLHDEFTYAVGQYSPNDDEITSPGLAQLINPLQDLITWFLNSRVAAVRRTINNWLVVDPSGIEIDDLTKRSPVIRLRPGATGGVDRYVKQLTVQDTTTNHLKDIEMLQSMIQMVTGINETALGQFASGRRSATEAKNVSSAAAARLRVAARLIFQGALLPMARQIVSNARQGLDEEQLIKVTGEATPMFIPVTKEALIGNYDFLYFDGTLPSERQYQAQTLQEVLSLIGSNPTMAMVLQYNPKTLMDEILRLRGIRNPSRFHLPPDLTNGLQQPVDGGAALPAGQNPGAPGITGVLNGGGAAA